MLPSLLSSSSTLLFEYYTVILLLVEARCAEIGSLVSTLPMRLHLGKKHDMLLTALGCPENKGIVEINVLQDITAKSNSRFI